MAALFASSVKMPCVFFPHSEDARAVMPFAGPHGPKMSLQSYANYFYTFQLSGMKLLLRELNDVSYCDFPLYTYKPGYIDFYLLKN